MSHTPDRTPDETPDEPAPPSPGLRVDSGGVPFAGRGLDAVAFADDTGGSDPALVAALDALTRDGSLPTVRDAMARLATARVLVPIVATPSSAAARRHGLASGEFDEIGESVEPGEPRYGEGGAASGLPLSDDAEMASVTLTAPDGRRALPVFTGVEAVAAWDPQARPTPKLVPEVARSAIEEGCDTLLIDLGSPHAAALGLSHLWALAQERPWLPPHEDPVVRLAVAEAAQGVEGLLRARAEDGTTLHGPGVLRLVLVLRPGLPSGVVDSIARLVGERLAADPEVRIRLDDLVVVLHGGAQDEQAPLGG